MVLYVIRGGRQVPKMGGVDPRVRASVTERRGQCSRLGLDWSVDQKLDLDRFDRRESDSNPRPSSVECRALPAML